MENPSPRKWNQILLFTGGTWPRSLSFNLFILARRREAERMTRGLQSPGITSRALRGTCCCRWHGINLTAPVAGCFQTAESQTAECHILPCPEPGTAAAERGWWGCAAAAAGAGAPLPRREPPRFIFGFAGSQTHRMFSAGKKKPLWAHPGTPPAVPGCSKLGGILENSILGFLVCKNIHGARWRL